VDLNPNLPKSGWQLNRNVVPADHILQMRDWLQRAAERARNTPSLEPEFEDAGQTQARKLRRLFWNDEPFWSQIIGHGLARHATALVGAGASVIFHAAFLKAPCGGSATPFHQDQAFWRYDYPGAVSMWLALDDTGRHNGCMELCSGSHLLPILPHHRRPDWVHPGIDLHAHNLDPEPIEMSAGDLLVWDKKLVHGSGINDSNVPRWGIVMVIADGSLPGFRAFDQQPIAGLGIAHDG